MANVLNKLGSKKYGWLVLLIVLVLVNILIAGIVWRLDLTGEKRYTLNAETSRLLQGMDESVEVDVFLKGDFPSGFKKLQRSTTDFLQLLKDNNVSKVHYKLISPQDEIPGTGGRRYEDTLYAMGVNPINLTVQVKAGEENKRIYPAALVTYKGRQSIVNLYSGNSNAISQQEINAAEALLEYQFAKAFNMLQSPNKPMVGYSAGNGEPDLKQDLRTADLQQSLMRDYNLFTLNLKTQKTVPDTFKVLMLVKPSATFTDDELFKIDQFVMRGGKLLCFIDNLFAEQDSLKFTANREAIAYDRNLNLTELFFKYGARINTDLVMDLQCDFLPFVVGGSQDNPQYEFLHWNYFPLFESKSNHPINKNMGLVAGRYVNSIDTINTPGIKKTVLLSSSNNSRTISTPALISLNENKNTPVDAMFRKKEVPVCMLLEGSFTSMYKNRATQSKRDSLAAMGQQFIPSGVENKIIIAADGDLVLNDVAPKEGPLPMGLNFYTLNTQYQYQFANREFLLNCLEYLTSRQAIIETRNKNIVLRLLDNEQVKENKFMWRMINIVLPILLVILSGFLYQWLRQKRYAQ